jgi:transposase
MKILISFPGIIEIGAATLIAKIYNLNNLYSGDQLVFWLGIIQDGYKLWYKFYNY